MLLPRSPILFQRALARFVESAWDFNSRLRRVYEDVYNDEGPDPAHEQLVVLPDVVGGYVDVFVPEMDYLGGSQVYFTVPSLSKLI